jgi:uncharacterized protein (TIGR02996 family)
MQPDDRRLVWADELLERGDPRGELITTQCALESELAREDSLRLRRREVELLAQLEDVGGPRGAIEEMAIRPADFLRDRAAIFEDAPLLHRLRLLDLPEDPSRAAAEIEAILDDERIDGLALGTANDPALVVELASHLPRLRSIELQGLTLGMAMRIDGLRNLDELSLTNLWDPFTARDAEKTQLRPRRLRLQSQSQQKQSVEIESLAHPDFFARLEDLELEWFVRPNVLVRASSSLLRRLRRLRLPMGIASAPLSLAADPADLENLEEISISFFGNEEEIHFGPLLTGEHFHRLRVLRIGPGLTTEDKVRELLQSPLARTLEVLDLRRNRWRLSLDDIAWDGIVLT